MRNGLRNGCALVLACVALLALAACGNSGGTSTSGGASTTSSTPTSKKISGTVTVWDYNYGGVPRYSKAVDQLTAKFEQLHPGVTVHYVAQPFAKYDQLLQASFTGRKGPDVLVLAPGAQGVLRWSKGLVRLDDRIDAEMRSSLSGWDSITPGFVNNGATYAVPVGLQGNVFYYNKKLFAKAGLPTDFKPTTWDEVKAAGEKLKAAGLQPFTGGNKEGYENHWWMSTVWPTVDTQAQAISLAEGKTPYTDQSVTKEMQVQKMLQDAGLFGSDRFTTPLFPDGIARFSEGKAGMFLGEWSGAGYYGDYNPKLGEKNVGIFLAPGAKYLNVVPVFAMGIPSYAKNQDAAWAYLQFVTSVEGSDTLYKVGGFLPNNKGVSPAADAPVQERELLKDAADNKTFAATHQMIPGAVLTTMQTAMNEVLQGRESIADAQKAMQSTADQNR